MNIFDPVVPNLPAEAVDILLDAETVRIERIVSSGHVSPEGFWYDQREHEWVIVLSGHGSVEYQDGGRVELGPGDHLRIPARVRHRVSHTDPHGVTIWLAVFYR